MGSSVQRLKENKQRESGGSENNEKRKGDVCFEKKKSIDGEREGWRWRWRSLVVICGRGAASRCVPLTHL